MRKKGMRNVAAGMSLLLAVILPCLLYTSHVSHGNQEGKTDFGDHGDYHAVCILSVYSAAECTTTGGNLLIGGSEND